MGLVPTLVTFTPATIIRSADVNANLTAIRDVVNTYGVLTDVARTISVAHTISADPGLIFSAAVSRIVPGATSFSVRNNANTADNLLISDAGILTIRNAVTVLTVDFLVNIPATKSFIFQVNSVTRASFDTTGKLTIPTTGLAVKVGPGFDAGIGADGIGNLTIYSGDSAGAAIIITGATSAPVKIQAQYLLETKLSATGVAGFRLPHGAAPTSPVNGDVWTTTAGLYVRINGATVGPLT